MCCLGTAGRGGGPRRAFHRGSVRPCAPDARRVRDGHRGLFRPVFGTRPRAGKSAAALCRRSSFLPRGAANHAPNRTAARCTGRAGAGNFFRSNRRNPVRGIAEPRCGRLRNSGKPAATRRLQHPGGVPGPHHRRGHVGQRHHRLPLLWGRGHQKQHLPLRRGGAAVSGSGKSGPN